MGKLAAHHHHLLHFAFFFFFFFSFSQSHTARQAKAQNATSAAVHVGVILDMDKSVGKMCRTSISMAVDDFYAAHGNYTTRLVLHTRESGGDVVGAASAALDLMKNVEVQAIIGPHTSAQAMFVTDLGSKAQVPIVSFSATSPSLSPAQSPYFVRTTLNSSAQVDAIASVAKAFGWREAVPIYEDTEFGTGFLPFLVDALQEAGIRAPRRSLISPSAGDDQIEEELNKLWSMQTRVFVVHMSPPLGSRLFLKAEELGMMAAGYVWIITQGMADQLDSLDSRVIDSMQGVLGVKSYIATSRELDNFRLRWRNRFRRENPDAGITDITSNFPLWAYDTAWAMALAAEKSGAAAANPLSNKSQISDNSTDLATLRVSQTGQRLLEAISATKFKGLSGEFRLEDRQLQSPAFRIVNVIGKAARGVGFWTPEQGISQQLNPTGNETRRRPSREDLRAIVWPGGSKDPPKGWEIPTGEKKLRVGVPAKAGFSEFVKVERDPAASGAPVRVSGYCIDVFDAVMKSLPYTIPYDYLPFEDAQGQSTVSYDELVDQVYLSNYDAVVGDITIIANRSLYVDFTLPYTESGVSMIVPIKEDESKNAWIFLKPLTTDLWLGSMAFFFFTGFVVWVIEHRINEEFRGPPSQQIGIIFYFAFSTLVFAHKEKVESNLSRFVVIIWVFVVLILTSSYTASLTSMLTVQQLQPTVTDVEQLLKNGDYVGYQEGSFVVGFLKRLNFDEAKLKNYTTPADFADGLSKGSHNGGVAAIFDEIPYIKTFLSEYCSDFMMVGPTYKADGFGFVFPRGSPLVPDVSRAILSVTEGEKMLEIEKKWFGEQMSCPTGETNALKSNDYRLSFSSFWGLFLVTGAISTVALFIFSSTFAYKNWVELTASSTAPTNSSLRRRLVAWARHYDRRDLSSEEDKPVAANGCDGAAAVDGSSVDRDDGSQSPFSVSVRSFENSGTAEEGRLSTEMEQHVSCTELPPEFTSIEITEING